ncbi:enoyl-CoA hydratase/isomerase family protein [Oceanobacillus damuensis]|uniref:enoyl-CoA hydratase/isomerase family protein n=1 Tax=Oceanobacillus damuensis TaxID=937928 RepID=UPI00082AE220|nr:enoyl-CoA hydratase/isomerase family protein [Oceanobacillus damuensis]
MTEQAVRDSEPILQEVENKVGYITLNRPNNYNALNTELMRNLKRSLLEFNKNESVHCIVIRGAGNAFSAGADIKEFSSQTDNKAKIEERAQLTMEIHQMVNKLDKPVIASVQGYVYAGGCGIALGSDLVVAADNAVFSYPEIKRGFVPAIVSPNLVRILDRKRAFELLITGRKLHADEAYSWGLVNEVIPLEDLASRTKEFAEEIAAYSLNALTMTKNLFYEVAEGDFDNALQTARQSNIKMRQTDAFKKGVESFINRK